MALESVVQAVQLIMGRHRVSLERPRVMGVLNVTPDSFSDGGRFYDPALALDRAWKMVEEGADLIDIGGESTRPGALAVPLAEELERVIPLVRQLAPRLPVPVSVDTSKALVMEAAIAAGAGMVNDVTGLRDPACRAVLAAAPDVAVCVMHMQGEPRTMQQSPEYADVVGEVGAFFAERLALCDRDGIDRRRVVLDPGFGFGKARTHNYVLLRELSRFSDIGQPLLVGLSRKSMLGQVTGRDSDGRLSASLAAATLAVWAGARIVRAHDVAATRDALAIVQATRDGGA